MKYFENVEKIQKKYGELLFRMGITYLFNKGTEHLPSIDLNKVRSILEKQEAETKAKGHISLMTVDFQMDFIECAKELSEIELWKLLGYVKENVSIDGCTEYWKLEDLIDDLRVDYNRLSQYGKSKMDEMKEILGEKQLYF
jgi:hypothetical protein